MAKASFKPSDTASETTVLGSLPILRESSPHSFPFSCSRKDRCCQVWRPDGWLWYVGWSCGQQGQEAVNCALYFSRINKSVLLPLHGRSELLIEFHQTALALHKVAVFFTESEANYCSWLLVAAGKIGECERGGRTHAKKAEQGMAVTPTSVVNQRQKFQSAKLRPC